VGLCEELGTSTFGRSLNEAEDRLNEAVELNIRTLEDVGEIERFFEEHNIPLHRDKPGKELKICVSTDESVFTRLRIQPLQELTPA
jgi:predicted RNase H-like HicB family nuclease